VSGDNWLGALRQRDFRLYFAGRVASFVGTGMVPVALSFAVLEQGRSVTAVGIVLGAETLPMVAFLLIGGVVADRLGARRVMIASDLVRAAAQGALAAWLIAGRPPLVAFVAAEAVVGAGTAFFTPAMTGFIPQVADQARLQQANSLNMMTFWLGDLVGPALAGIIVASAGAGWAIAADALTYLVSGACLVAVRSRPPRVTSREPLFRDLRVGWRVFWSKPWLWAIVVQFAFFHLVVFAPFLVLGAAMARAHLGGVGAWGAILACNGFGGVAAGIVMLRFRPRRPLVLGEVAMLAWALPGVALATNAAVPVVAAAAFAAGVGAGVFGPLWDTTMQQEIPAELLSRVSAYDWFGSLVFLPVGYAAAGPLANLLGETSTLVGGAVFFACATIGVLVLLRTAAPGVETSGAGSTTG
jgi:MFS family permease